jgi:hypothetical protein
MTFLRSAAAQLYNYQGLLHGQFMKLARFLLYLQEQWSLLTTPFELMKDGRE